MSFVWQIRLAERAELDFLDITAWTAENFGARQAEYYAETVTLAMEALHDGPEIMGAKARDDIGSGIRTLHVARQGRKGRHLVVFKEAEGRIIDVLRLLHDSMDLPRHVPVANNQAH
ncbi:MAG: Plasmid stabilization system protein [Candidatus Accumulibacter adjunctus]|uniref:Plasmid stabilization system protein n=1 Tax=Candidatus Accumulibacter adjunctus TaxID=1454001 RepID=A0A011MBK5_9PROT|nr:MAG: Plasmid stabilization system protein [Candidatus Accumulibacter adjunctus]